MTDETTGQTTPGSGAIGSGAGAVGGTGASDATPRQEMVDHLGAAFEHLKAAVKELGDVVERGAKSELDKSRPEVRTAITDLQSGVETLANRARGALDDLSNRFDLNDRLDPKDRREDV